MTGHAPVIFDCWHSGGDVPVDSLKKVARSGIVINSVRSLWPMLYRLRVSPVSVLFGAKLGIGFESAKLFFENTWQI